MSGITPRERILTALSRKEPDRVPMDIFGFNREAFKIFQQHTGSDNSDEYFQLDFRRLSFKPTVVNLQKYASYHCKPLPPDTIFTEWGTALVPGSLPAFDHHIPPLTGINSLQEIEEYPLPDLEENYRHQHLDKAVAEIKSRRLAVLGDMTQTIFEVAWLIRGLDELLTDFFLNKEYARCLLDRITGLRCFQAERFARAGVDILFVGDDVGMQDRLMMNPETWREWLKPRLARVIENARKVNPRIFVLYHSDGNVNPIISDLIDIGINVLNPVQPECMDPVKLKKQYGTRLAFWGTVGIQTTLPFGTPEEIKKVVKDRVETVGKGGGLVIGPTHVVEPDVPWENLMAFVEAVKQFGRYH